MNFLELKDISERYLEEINPISAEKILTIGRIAGLSPGQRVIDFGCGFGEPLRLWVESYGISGVGIDIRAYACQRARQKMLEHGLNERIQIVQANGAEYQFEPGSFDLAACVGATFIWDGYREALQKLRQAIHPQGKLIVGEAYWNQSTVPPQFAQNQKDIITETQILEITHQEGFDVEYVVRASHDDWDRYEAGNWLGLLRWIEENPGAPNLQEVIDHLHESQDEYFRYGREYFGWALYLLNPVKY
jgi:ubiquinone/menaquinone biosynthesis C-methylase UbiE